MEGLVNFLVDRVPSAECARSHRAIWLSKADLSTGMVGEFPELQGVMGRYYALHDDEDVAVANAIAEHYKPLGPNDTCPSAPDSVVAALADRIDTLAAFFTIGEPPTGSRDPYALRRAATGIVRLILENKIRLSLGQAFALGTVVVMEQLGDRAPEQGSVKDRLLHFIADRVKLHLRDQGVRHDLIAAVFAVDEDDLVRLLARVDALSKFLQSEDGANLLTAYRRAANIVAIEERRDNCSYDDEPDWIHLPEPAEKTLARALPEIGGVVGEAVIRGRFDQAMSRLATLRRPVDDFFDKVTVNCDDAALRENRLRLLSRIRDTMNQIADFSQIEG
jgi:glycyl-tRNA synthetase beta chain